jgi:formylglycine-generating enzyme required for sulfatase activity
VASTTPTPEVGRSSDEGPQHKVTFATPLVVGRFAVTFDEWDACVAEGGCRWTGDKGWGRGRRPVINVSWDDAKAYVEWLSRKTGMKYRLLSEAEREYVTRAGAPTPYWWGSSISDSQANYSNRTGKTVPVDSFAPNTWGVYQVHGNVWEWTEDCWHDKYDAAPADGSAWTSGECARRVVRGGAWNNHPEILRSAYRSRSNTDNRVSDLGFRWTCPGLVDGCGLGITVSDLTAFGPPLRHSFVRPPAVPFFRPDPHADAAVVRSGGQGRPHLGAARRACP